MKLQFRWMITVYCSREKLHATVIIERKQEVTKGKLEFKVNIVHQISNISITI